MYLHIILDIVESNTLLVIAKLGEINHSVNSDLNHSLSNSADYILPQTLPSIRSLPTFHRPQTCRIIILRLTDHWLFTLTMTVLTVFALIGDDLRLAATDKDYDTLFYSMNVVCLVFFTFDLLAAVMVRDKYLFSFFFWLDLVSTVSLVADIGWLWELIIGSGLSVKQTVRSSQVFRAGRASRAGTRIIRIIRIFRVIRMTRIVKLYRIAKETKQEMTREESPGTLQRTSVSFRGFHGPVAQGGPGHMPEQEISEEETGSASFTFGNSRLPGGCEEGADLLHTDIAAPQTEDRIRPMSTIEREENDEIRIPDETKVGKKLSDLTTQRTIILVLGLMLMMPVFMNNLYIDENTSYIYGLKIILRFAGRSQADFDLAWQSYIDQHSSIPTPIIYLEIPGVRLWEADTHWYDLRNDEQNIVEFFTNEYDVLAVFNLKSQSQIQSALNIGKTVFICLVLTITAMLFTKDANLLVIGPIENMVEKVQRIARNPLEAAQQSNKESVIFQQQPKEETGFLETVQLERTIEKIGALLAIGFGEAGSDIIVSNMRISRGEVNPMLPGHRMECIFGFCDIRNFTDATEVLQEGVMQFVNEIAFIVHTTVHCFSGAANKNIGDAFLLVWKLPSMLSPDCCEPGILPEKHMARQLADMSVMSFLKVCARIHTSPVILKYRHDAELTARMPNYSVKMGFGLHAGWAIEGAIGSEFKIDPSYLSPHVNMASRLEAATKQYGVTILVSEKVYQLSTVLTRRHLREIDNVIVKGSQQPVKIFTLDFDPSKLTPSLEPAYPDLSDKRALKVLLSERRSALRRAAIKEKRQLTYLYEEDEDFNAMLSHDLSEFRHRFAAGLWRYREGKWLEAAVMLTNAERLLGKPDGPTRTLLRFMNESRNMAPDTWRGYRELMEK